MSFVLIAPSPAGYRLLHSELDVAMIIQTMPHNGRGTPTGAALAPAAACRRNLSVAVGVPCVVMNLRGDSVIRWFSSGSDLQYPEGLPVEAFLKISDVIRSPGRMPNALTLVSNSTYMLPRIDLSRLNFKMRAA